MKQPYESQSPLVGAFVPGRRESDEPDCSASSLNPLWSGRSFRGIDTDGLNLIGQCLNPLWSGRSFRADATMVSASTVIGLNPLWSGRSFRGSNPRISL